MKTFKVALDWTANTNHSGFYVAKEMGWYEQEGLHVELLTPDQDNYAITPAKKVELGLADVALCPLESIISYNTKKTPFNAVAIAAIFREDVSAIVVLEKSEVQSPKDLDGKSYASYKARYEDHIVSQMIKNDGGVGELQLKYPDKLGIWDTLVSGKYDATWIFTNWEGIHAKAKGIKLRSFKMADYGIPYSYSPVIMANVDVVKKQQDLYCKFLKATKKGYLWCQENPKAAADAIAPFIASCDADIDLLHSQKQTNPYYGTTDNWGIMEEANVNQFLKWLKENKLEQASLHYNDLVYNEFLG